MFSIRLSSSLAGNRSRNWLRFTIALNHPHRLPDRSPVHVRFSWAACEAGQRRVQGAQAKRLGDLLSSGCLQRGFWHGEQCGRRFPRSAQPLGGHTVRVQRPEKHRFVFFPANLSTHCPNQKNCVVRLFRRRHQNLLFFAMHRAGTANRTGFADLQLHRRADHRVR